MDKHAIYNLTSSARPRGEPRYTTEELGQKFGISAYQFAALLRCYPDRAPAASIVKTSLRSCHKRYVMSDVRRWAAHNQIDFSKYAQ